MLLINGDCLEKMKDIPDKSVDLIFCDLPYGQTSCKWDCQIDLDEFWKQVMRIKIINAPIIMTTTTKFGVSLINSAPKKCPFRYDLVWCKSASCGFLSAKKMPMRKHEMIYVFYEKLPFYDLSSHKHKFITKDESVETKEGAYGGVDIKPPKTAGSRYEPALPDSLIKETDINAGGNNCNYDVNKNTYGGGKEGRIKISKDKKDHVAKYDPPLPDSLIKEGGYNEKYTYKQDKETDLYGTDIRKEMRTGKDVGKSPIYEPPLPNSLIKETDKNENIYSGCCNGETNDETQYRKMGRKNNESAYEPPLPDSLLEVKSTRGKHSTEKPVELMKWILKYYSKEGSCILDATMGSGSMGVACVEMKRNFIGIELDEDIYNVAVSRINNNI